MDKYSPNSQNSKSAISLQYLIKEVRDEIHFLHADKHKSFLQVNFSTLIIKVLPNGDTIIIDRHDKVFSNY